MPSVHLCIPCLLPLRNKKPKTDGKIVHVMLRCICLWARKSLVNFGSRPDPQSGYGLQVIPAAERTRLGGVRTVRVFLLVILAD